VEQVEPMEGRREMHRVLVRKPEGMGQYGKPSRKWEDCAESGLRKWDRREWTAIFRAGIRKIWEGEGYSK